MSDQGRTCWQTVDPDGTTTEFTADFFEACDLHGEFACIWAGCPEAFGWHLVDLDTGTKHVPEEIEARIVAVLGR